MYLTVTSVVQDKNQSGALLSLMGEKSAGKWLKIWVSVDAVLVLSGAVLTAYLHLINDIFCNLLLFFLYSFKIYYGGPLDCIL